MNKLIGTLLLILLPKFSVASSVDNTQGVWFGTFNKKQLGETYSWWTETQVRYNTEQGNLNQFLYRTGLLKKLENGHEAGLLAAVVQTGTTIEYRPTLQYSLVKEISPEWKISSRNRLELRHLQEQSEESLRLRTLIRGDRKINDDYDLVIWDEPFFHLQDTGWTSDSFVDRNRFFIGAKIKKDHYWAEVGYLNQHAFLNNKQQTSEHLAVVYLFF